MAKKVTRKPKSKAPAKKIAKKVAVAKKPSMPKKVVAYKLSVGDAAPAFSSASTAGGTKSLSDFKGRTVVLYFYPKDNTPGCTLEGQDFKRLHKQFAAAHADIVGVSQDSLKSHENFKAKCGFPFELLSDEDGGVCRAFDVIQMKSMYGRQFQGIERSTFVIDKMGVVRHEWRKVKVGGHAEEVLAAVQGLRK